MLVISLLLLGGDGADVICTTINYIDNFHHFSAVIVVFTATSRMIVFYCWYHNLITIVASFSF